ncbi:alpha/beta hydrolase domain-containing protein [Sphingomonas sp. BIUV-7]|uniref:Alpha/beta hydrolase domain-containing protein n=1 Tax=Sphingomonas natans TaxID=3063330 RepID=A0ABT8YAA1_9SPHN|nr:alpha/beta hydrolase domain-containing protein [Sphingomonas sp. BIUV-7]MDO6415261.1 alpha/beta hydrolase domain-containing protein [Sphingomonas sp. BIUV-7]
MMKRDPSLGGGALRRVVTATLLILAGSGVAAAEVPIVTRAPAVGKMFLAAPISLDTAGYTEKELFMSGVANRYRFANSLANADVMDSGHPYKTRLIVRAPKDPTKFNGIVVVEWLNVTTKQDGDFVFGPAHDYLLRDGYAYVGVTVQRTGIAALHRMNGPRYAGLSLDAPNTDTDGKIIDPENFGSLGGDVLSWDVWTQVGEQIKAGKILGGLKIKQMIASGQSQSAGKLTTYYNSIHPLKPVYDAFIFYDRAGPLRTDIDTKSIAVGTEFFSNFQGTPPADTATHRWWEIAGASHNSYREIADYVDLSFRQDAANRDPNGKPLSLSDIIVAGQCVSMPIWSRVPNGFVLSAAFEAIKNWLTSGKAPPARDRLVMDANGKTKRDANGLVDGGIRTATYTVPNGINVGVNTGGGFCMLAGSHKDFTEKQMCERYMSQGNYVAQFAGALDADVARGVLLRPDADTLLTEAKAVKFQCS